MAKKNLHSLMSGIIGTETNDVSPVSSEASTPAEVTKQAKPGRGRPKKDNDDVRSTFLVSSELMRKIKYISLMEGILLKDIVDEALSSYVDKWEKENVIIKFHKK